MITSIPMAAEGGPVSPMNYQRALVRPPPREFTVEVLSPVKHGSNWSYGIKVCPITRPGRDSDLYSLSSRSTSTSSYTEYEIWRRWEDCLDFQETLEAEYSTLSRQKVKVLRRGATGKKKGGPGLYTLTSNAASFESLPEGPDPRDVAVNVHDLIPSLTRKGTMFRVSRNVVNQRGEEFAAMIQALFNTSQDEPVLLQELRNCSPVRHFFGFWRRDKDIQKHAGKDVSSLFHSNKSLSSLPSTAPSSPSPYKQSVTPTTPASPWRRSVSMRLASRGKDELHIGQNPNPPMSAPPHTRRFVSSLPLASRSSTSLQQRYKANSNTPDSSMTFTDELLLEDDLRTSPESPLTRRSSNRISHAPLGHSSTRFPEQLSRPSTGIPDPIPEEELPRPLPRTRRISCAAPEHRNARIFMSPPNSLPFDPEKLAQLTSYDPAYDRAASPPNADLNRPNADLSYTLPSPTSSHSTSSSSRPSTMSMIRLSAISSISSYFHPTSKRSSRDSRQSFDSDTSELDFPFTTSPIVLHTPLSKDAEHNVLDPVPQLRDSFASSRSDRTDLSADALISRASIMRMQRESPPLDSCGPSNTNVMGLQALALKEATTLEGGDNSTDSHLADTPELLGIPKTDKTNFPPTSLRPKNSLSSTRSTESFNYNHSPPSPLDSSFTIKTLYHDSIVVFRAERNMPLAIVRQKIRDRFSIHESMPLSQDFVLAYLPSRAPIVKVRDTVRRGRSNSTTDMPQQRLLESEGDWQIAITTSGGKVTLRILDAETPV